MEMIKFGFFRNDFFYVDYTLLYMTHFFPSKFTYINLLYLRTLCWVMQLRHENAVRSYSVFPQFVYFCAVLAGISYLFKQISFTIIVLNWHYSDDDHASFLFSCTPIACEAKLLNCANLNLGHGGFRHGWVRKTWPPIWAIKSDK